jgi:RHS repeat-associated protein
VTITFNSSTIGEYTGTLSVSSDTGDNGDEIESPFVLNLHAQANRSGTPPWVTLTAPTQNQSITAPTNFLVTATASATSPDTVSKVDFYAIGPGGTSFIGSDSSAPYSTNWVLPTGGPFTVRAIVTDTAGRVGTQSVASVMVNDRPVAEDLRTAVHWSSANVWIDPLFKVSDANGDALFITNITAASNGMTNLIGGRIYYTPTNGVGFDHFTYTVTDHRGGVAVGNIFISIIPSVLPAVYPDGEITSPANQTRVTAPIEVRGTALSWFLQFWRLQYRRRSPVATSWQTFAEGEIGVTNEVLGVFDPTGLPNGAYQIQLRVTDWVDGTTIETDPVTVQVGELSGTTEGIKVGQFTVAFNDLSIPVSGLPITLTRNYDSRLTDRVGDFGAGWDLAVSSVRLEKSGVLGEGWAATSGLMACVQNGPSHLVTITFPDGTAYRFAPRLKLNYKNDNCVVATGLGQAHAEMVFDALPGSSGTLEALNAPDDLEINATLGLAEITLHESRGEVTDRLDIIYDPAEFLFTSLDGRKFLFNPAGKVVKMADRNGNTLTFSDDGIIHSSGKSVRFVRDTDRRITEIFDPNGLNGAGEPAGPAALVYRYKGLNLEFVSRLTDRATSNYVTTTFLYENAKYPSFLTAIKDPRGITGIRNEYDENGKLKSHTDADGKTITYIHDINGRKETIVDRLGHTNTFSYDARGNITNSVNALGHTNLFTYDTNGNMLTHTDPLGNTTTNTYDPTGNVLSVTLPHKPGENSESFTTRFAYDQFGNQTSVTLPTGAVIANAFDPSTGDLLSVKAGTNVITSYNYDSAGNVTAEVDRFGTNSFELDSYGNATRFTNSLGQVIASDYDANGNLTNLVDGTNITRLAYDAMGRETTSDYGSGIALTNTYDSHLDWTSVDAPTVGHMERRFDQQGRLGGWTTVNGSTPGFAYNANGNLEYETNTLGVVMHTTYDAGGRVIAVTNLTTGAGSRYGYDAADRRIAETNALGFTTHFGYNPDGSLAAMTNAFGTNYWLYAYETGGSCCGGNGASVTVTDPLGRQLQAINSEYGLPLQTIFTSGTNVATTTTTYLSGMVSPDQEAEEYPATITDEGGRTRTNTYTARGQLETSTDLGGNKWINKYDTVSGALTNILSPTGESLFYTYDELDNRKTIQFPDGNWLINWFDAANRLASNSLPSGVRVHYQYDFAGRITNRSSTIGETNSFEYNLADAVTVMTDNTGSTTNLYDAAGRLYGIDYPTGASVRYGFDLLGQITSITNKPSSTGTERITHYGYDAVGNITNVTDPFNGVTSFEYDRVGRKRKRTLPNGVVTTYDYNWRDQLTNIVHKTSGGTTLASAYYERAPFGEPTKITREDGTYVVLKYNASLRLTNEAYYSSGGALQTSNSYGYDAAGNRIQIVTGGVTYTNLVSAGYRITEVKNGAATAETYSYDNGGRVTSMMRGGTTRNFGYNSSDQLTAVTNGATWTAYSHDAQGRRTKAVDNTGAQRRFLVAGTPATDLESPHLIADSTNGLKQGYVFVGDDPVLRYDSSGSRVYYLEDAMGSVIGLAPHSSPGTANTSRLFYDGFGKTRLTNGPAPALPSGTGGDFRFHGAWWESATDLYHMRAREYDQRMGRFMSRDPAEGSFAEPESLNPYVFAYGNPLIYADPSGEFTVIEINLTTFLQFTLQTMRAGAISQAKGFAYGALADMFTGLMLQQMRYLIPGFDMSKLSQFLAANPLGTGSVFDQAVRFAICQTLGKSAGLGNRIHFGVRIVDQGPRQGDPISAGRNCNGANPRVLGQRRGASYSIPDFIFGDAPLTKPNIGPPAYARTEFIAEVKSRATTLSHEFVRPASNARQLNAILQYARQHTSYQIAMFIIAKKDINVAHYYIVKRTLGAKALSKGVVPVVVTASKSGK